MPDVSNWKDPDYEPIYEWRKQHLSALRRGGDDAWDAAWCFYREHPVEAIEHFVTTYDPRLANRGVNPYIPFVLFPKQRECIYWMWGLYKRGEQGILEKSRDCGASWLTLAFAWWLWTFNDGIQIGFGSRKQDLVDKIGDPDSLLQKLRILIENLPKELRPLGWKSNEDQPHLRIKNRETRSVIVGQGGRNIGRGGRSTLYVLDEAAFLEHPEDAEAALSANADAQILVSTPNGMGNPFARKRWGGNFSVFTFHWTKDPRKDADWYAKKKLELEPEVLAQEVDLDYEASSGDVAIPARYVRASQALRKQLQADGLMPVMSHGIAGLDVGGGGEGLTVLCPRYGVTVQPCIAWSDDDTTDVAGKARDESIHARCEIIKFDSVGIGRGVLSTFRRMPGIRTMGVNTGERTTRDRWPDGKRSKDKFVNLKAELWWIVRERLRRTYQFWLYYNGHKEGQKHEIEDLLLIPDDPNLSSQLSLPKYFYTTVGKIQIESKERMASRSVASPDYADALILTFAPRPARRGSGRTVSLY